MEFNRNINSVKVAINIKKSVLPRLVSRKG